MSWGNLLNSATGANASARKQYEYNKRLQDDAQEFAKWQMGNAHQMEMEDLEKAGLNPVLSAGGSGASAGVSANSVSAPSGGMDPLTLMSTALNAYSTIQETKNNTAKTNADIKNETEMTQANVAKALAEAGYKQHEIDYYLENGYFPGQTKTKTTNTSFPFGFGGGTSETVPATNKNNIKIPNSARTNEKKNKTVEEKRIQRLKEIGYRN